MMQGGSLWAVDRRLRERYRSFIRAEFWFRDPALRRLFAEELENIELMREPYLEFAPPYRLGRPSRVVFRDLLDREVLREFIQAVRGDRPLYSHQEEALRRVWRGRNVVVATGTGSGKTEAFLLPILLSLYEEWSRGTLGPGVRALVLYPMNALAFDQRARLAEIARALKEVNSSFRFTFGQYTGQTPEDERDGIRRVGDEEERRAPHTIREGGRVVHGELLYRNEMRATPPHILITNYSMLEYLLIRPSDSPFFDGESARSWRFFVVDEVHTYSGVRGQELALLLRRLKERLRAAGNCQTFRCIATSATLFAAEDAEARIADFAARLFGEPFDSEDVIVGQRTDLDEHLPDGGDEDLREALVRLQSVLQEGPKQVSEVASSVFPGEDIEQARVCLFELLHHIETSGSGRALSALRLHVFVRGLEGAYVRYTPELEVTFADQSDAEGKCFELALCRTCGQHYLVGQIEKERFGAANRDYSSPDYRVDYLLPLDEDAGNLTANYWLCPKCSTLGTSASCHRGCGVPLIPILFQEEAHDRESGELKYCLVCNEWTADPVRELVYGGEWPQAVIATTILEVLPPERQKLLAFADNRQDAAYFAVRLDEWALELALRRALVEAIENLSDHTGTQVLSLRDVHNALRSSVPKLMDLGVASTDAERSRNLWELLLRELNRADHPRSLESTGLAVWRVGWQQLAELPDDVLAGPLMLGREQAIEVAELLLLSLVRSNALATDLLGNSPAALESPVRCVRIGSPGKESDVISWDGVDRRQPNRRVDYVSKILRRQNTGLSDQEARALAGQVLRELWGWILEKDEGSRERDRLLVKKQGKGWQLNPLWLRLMKIGRDETYYRCDCCGRVFGVRGAGPCPRYRCPGTLQPCTQTSDERWIYRELYSAYDDWKRFFVEEHTAQLTTQKGQEYQLRFSRGELHVLSCSTTFELGVDLGDIDAVFMRNVPPEPFNYAQRAGRTGRRHRLGLVVTFCRRRPHDLYHFLDPGRLLRGEGRVVVPRHWSERVIQRHVNAVVFSCFFRRYPDRFRAVEALVGSRWEPGELLDQLERFIANHSGVLSGELRAVLNDCIGAEEYGGKVEALLRAVIDGEGILGRALAEVCEDYGAVRRLEAWSRDAGKYDDAKWASQRADTIAREDVLSFLSRKAVIPKYGFPVDVVELTVPDIRYGVELTRDLRFAIAEYAPGQMVIANKWSWKSGGVKIVPGRALPWRKFRCCERHRTYVECDYSEQAALPPLSCGCRGVSGEYVQPIFGFFVPRNGVERAWFRPGRDVSTTTFVVDSGSALDSITTFGDPPTIRVAAVTRLPVVVLSRGVRGQGFRICLECGTSAPTNQSSRNHRGRDGRACEGQFRRFSLGYSFLTDVVRIDFLLPVPNDDRDALSHGLVAALLAGVSTALEVPVTELGGSPVYAEPHLSVVLFDNVPAGGGIVAQLNEASVLRDVLRQAYVQVSGRCGCGPDGSCYSCLRRFDNQFVHTYLRRGIVRKYLDEILQSF